MPPFGPPRPLIRPGDAGPAVATVQQTLAAMGFYGDVIDGHYGPITQAAVAAFQQTRGLPPLGDVDALTLAALGFEVDEAAITPHPPLAHAAWQQVAMAMFPDAPRGHIAMYLPLVLQALSEAGLAHPAMTLAALATIRAETAGFAPIGEFVSAYNTTPGERPYGKYDFRRDIGNGAVGDGERFRGRGFIQLTGRANYQAYSQRLGMGDALIQNPDLANDPLLAARLLAAFLRDKAAVIEQALARRDFATARKAVNGGTHGLSQFTQAFERGVLACQTQGIPVVA